MLPFLNMRLYRGNNPNLSKHLEKLRTNQLTIENVLEEDEIIQDLKLNNNSQFINLLSNDAIRKLIDYATKMPASDDQKIGHKYPFNATEILCADNAAIQERIMNEMLFKEEDIDEAGKENKENQEEEEVEEKEAEEGKKEEQKMDEENQEKPKEVEEQKPEPPKEEEPKPETPKEESKPEAPKDEEPKPEAPKEETKPETPKDEEQKPEEPKPEESKPEEKPEQKAEEKPEQKPEEKAEEKKETPPKEEVKNEVTTENVEKKEGAEEPAKEEGEKEEGEEKKETPPKEGQEKEVKSEVKEEKEGENGKKEENEEENKKEENEEEEDEERQQKQYEKEDDDDENQKDNEENEDSEAEDQSKTVIVYDNIDYLFNFLNQPKETITNHVLIGYFYKILNHLISSQSNKIVRYIFEYPYKYKLDILNLIVSNLTRKSMGLIVNKLLLFNDEQNELNEKKILLTLRILEELEKCQEKDKFECICDVLASTLNNKNFYILFMNDPKLVDLLFSLLEKSEGNQPKLICIINLLIKVNENVLKNFSTHCTKNLIPENPLDFMSLFNYETSYPSDEKQINNEDMDEINKTVLLSLFNALKKSEFKFMEDFGVYNKDNEEFLTTYKQKQKKLGVKKLAQSEFLRSILDLFVNSYNSDFHKQEIEELVEIINKKTIFSSCHKLFFDFPFSNIYQSYYSQIFDIVLNQNAPKNLIQYFIKYSDEKGEKNLISELMEHFFKEMKFKFTSDNYSFNPCISFEVTLLNKIYTSENDNVKQLFIEDNDFKVFDEVLGEEINKIFNQKLLLADTLGANLGTEEEKPLPTFGKSNFMEIIDEDAEIYKTYKEGNDYKAKLNAKLERERQEREKMEQEIVGDDEENKDEQIHQEDEDENEEGIEEMNVEKEGEEEGGEEENNRNEDEIGKDIINEEKEKSVSTEESAEEKTYNDVNFWNAELKPSDDIMSAILNDIE